MAAPKFATHEDYIDTVAPDVRPLLERIQRTVERAVPGAERCIGYNIPAYRRGKTFLYFAAFKKHIGIYPPVRDDAELIEELAPYRGEKGNLSFPLAEPLPIALIRRVAVALAAEHAGR